MVDLMTALFPLHLDDEKQLIKIRRYLIGFRHTNGWNQPELSVRINGTRGIAWDLEYNKSFQWRLSRLQGWVKAFDLRLAMNLRFPLDPDLEQRVLSHPEVTPFAALAATIDNWPKWQRMALTAALTVTRTELGLSTEQMAQRLGITAKALRAWERAADEVMLPKVLHHARVLGGYIEMELEET
jgi:DNA-binding XRE family transcriptional regulator